jgi:hypothetical protein
VVYKEKRIIAEEGFRKGMERLLHDSSAADDVEESEERRSSRGKSVSRLLMCISFKECASQA